MRCHYPGWSIMRSTNIYRLQIVAVSLYLLTTALLNSTLDASAQPAGSDVHHNLIAAVEQYDVRAVKSLLDRGADPNTVDRYNQTPLRRAMYADVELDLNFNPISHKIKESTRLAIVKLLLSRGADPNKHSPLIRAAVLHQDEIVALLLAYGANANARDESGRTALFSADVNPKMYKALLRYHADVNAKDKDGRSVLMHAADGGVCRYVKFLLENGAEVNARDNYHRNALAYGMNEPSIVRILLAKGADINEDGDQGCYVLSRVSYDVKLMKLLIFKGANINSKSEDGRTPLMMATLMNSREGIIFLIQKGANVNARYETGSEKGYTALMTAIKWDVINTIKSLIANGADIHVTAKNGDTPLSLAEKLDNQRIYQFLKSLE